MSDFGLGDLIVNDAVRQRKLEWHGLLKRLKKNKWDRFGAIKQAIMECKTTPKGFIKADNDLIKNVR